MKILNPSTSHHKQLVPQSIGLINGGDRVRLEQTMAEHCLSN